MKIRWQTATLALVMAIFTWYLVTGREKVESWIPVPLEMVGTQEGLIIHEGLVNQIEVRVRGPRELVRSLKEQKLGYPLDVSELKVGNVAVELDPSLLDISEAYEIMELKPAHLMLAVDRVMEKRVSVGLAWLGENKLHQDYQLEEVKITPAFVQLVGPQSVLEDMVQVKVNLKDSFGDDVPETWGTDLPVITAEGVESRPGLVRVDLKLGPKTQVIPIKIRNFPLDIPAGINLSIRTKVITLEVEGPVFLFRDDKFRKEVAVVPHIEGSLKPGKVHLPFTVSLPEDCKLLSASPKTLTVIVKEK